jgi:predicted anti-sigma-YlaC factor YlaD
MAYSVTCNEFLERYSDYRDGIIQGQDRLRLEGHLAVCRQCQGYDARIARGIIVLQNSGEIEPSNTLKAQLRERIAAGRRPELPLMPTYAGVLAALVLIASVAVVLWDAPEPQIQTIVIDSAPPTTPVLPVSTTARPAALAPPEETFTLPAFGADWRAPGADEEPYIMKPAFTR